MLLLRLARIRFGLLHFLPAAAAWAALQASGVERRVRSCGRAHLGVPRLRGMTWSAPPTCSGLFREQPPEPAESARAGLVQALSPIQRLQRAYHPWTSYDRSARAGQRRHRDQLRVSDPEPPPHPSRSASFRATCSASRSASLAPPGSSAGQPEGGRDPGRLGGARWNRRNRRHRIHRLAADSQPLPSGPELQEAKLGILSAALSLPPCSS